MWKKFAHTCEHNFVCFFIFRPKSEHKMLLCVFSHVSYTSISFLQLRCYQSLPTVPSKTVEIDIIVAAWKSCKKYSYKTDIIYVLMQLFDLLSLSLSLIVCKYTYISNGCDVSLSYEYHLRQPITPSTSSKEQPWTTYY